MRLHIDGELARGAHRRAHGSRPHQTLSVRGPRRLLAAAGLLAQRLRSRASPCLRARFGPAAATAAGAIADQRRRQGGARAATRRRRFSDGLYLQRAAVAFAAVAWQSSSACAAPADLVYRQRAALRRSRLRVVVAFGAIAPAAAGAQGRAVDMTIGGVANDRLAAFARDSVSSAWVVYPREPVRASRRYATQSCLLMTTRHRAPRIALSRAGSGGPRGHAACTPQQRLVLLLIQQARARTRPLPRSRRASRQRQAAARQDSNRRRPYAGEVGNMHDSVRWSDRAAPARRGVSPRC